MSLCASWSSRRISGSNSACSGAGCSRFHHVTGSPVPLGVQSASLRRLWASPSCHRNHTASWGKSVRVRTAGSEDRDPGRTRSCAGHKIHAVLPLDPLCHFDTLCDRATDVKKGEVIPPGQRSFQEDGATGKIAHRESGSSESRRIPALCGHARSGPRPVRGGRGGSFQRTRSVSALCSVAVKAGSPPLDPPAC